jgi:transposase
MGESYSLDAEEQRRREADEATGRQRKRRQNSPRRGRISSQQKIDQADRSEIVLPDGFDVGQCTPLRERPVWRIEQGQAVRVRRSKVTTIRRPAAISTVPEVSTNLRYSDFGLAWA